MIQPLLYVLVVIIFQKMRMLHSVLTLRIIHLVASSQVHRSLRILMRIIADAKQYEIASANMCYMKIHIFIELYNCVWFELNTFGPSQSGYPFYYSFIIH